MTIQDDISTLQTEVNQWGQQDYVGLQMMNMVVSLFSEINQSITALAPPDLTAIEQSLTDLQAQLQAHTHPLVAVASIQGGA